MMKSRLSVYLDPETLRLLEAFAVQRGKSKSLVAETAITSFLTPDTAERHEAALARRLDQHTRVMERVERNLGIAIEMLALFIRFWLTATPPLPDAQQASAQAKGRERYEGFVAALGRRLSKGASFTREVVDDVSDER
ncbi:CopG family transcriptional regulator [Phenylobacterium aquaticum]|uniref:ribbon-helix-helix domain-containing protein n=1 Tax=Phenylobacterium aquaticum TaxID=1763816 RepID=UPI001F5DE5B9|nr:CopG family transcriptional regulator [Phenylobacterium aquaticum]MCI3132858.1 ribbon-helix-helix domain-containing protein [Phenylobacterium aquaticum]